MVADCGANCARWLLCLSNFVFIVSFLKNWIIQINIHFSSLINQIVSGGVLIIGTWLATDKASFIDLTLNNLTLSKYGPASSINNQDAEIILKVMGLVQSRSVFLIQGGS